MNEVTIPMSDSTLAFFLDAAREMPVEEFVFNLLQQIAKTNNY